MPSLANYVAALAVLSGDQPAATTPPTPAEVFAEFRAVCLDVEGDLETAQEIAVERGYLPVHHRVDDFQPLGNSSHPLFTYVWAKSVGGADVQVMLRPRGHFRKGGADDAVAYHDQCSVSVAPGRRSALRAEAARHLRQDSFRQMGSSVFAWKVDGNGVHPVRRPQFEANYIPLMRDEGMRVLAVSEHRDRAILTLMTPAREGCRARDTPSDTEPNIVCGFAED